jgi:hypothetical protein
MYRRRARCCVRRLRSEANGDSDATQCLQVVVRAGGGGGAGLVGGSGAGARVGVLGELRWGQRHDDRAGQCRRQRHQAGLHRRCQRPGRGGGWRRARLLGEWGNALDWPGQPRRKLAGAELRHRRLRSIRRGGRRRSCLLDIDDAAVGSSQLFINNAGEHLAYPTEQVVVKGISAGRHTVSLIGLATDDANDRFSVTIQEVVPSG